MAKDSGIKVGFFAKNAQNGNSANQISLIHCTILHEKIYMGIWVTVTVTPSVAGCPYRQAFSPGWLL